MALPILVLGGGDPRSSCIFRPSEQLYDGIPSYLCAETGAVLARDSGDKWVIGIPGTALLYTQPGGDAAPPEGRWMDSGASSPPVLTTLRSGACVPGSSSRLVESLGATVQSRLQDADELSSARRPNSAAMAYDAAHALAASRCDELGQQQGTAAVVPLPHALLLVASGSTYLRLGQVLRASQSPGAPQRAVTALAESVERMQLSRSALWLPMLRPASDQQLSHALLLLGHARLSLSPSANATKAMAAAAMRAFVDGANVDPTSAPAAAAAGRALVLYARQHLNTPSDAAQSNRTLEAAARSFKSLLLLLEEQNVAPSARRDDIYSGRPPLWWADALLSLGQVLQLLAAANEVRARLAVPPAPAPPLPPRGVGPPSAGSAMLTRAARATYQRGVALGIWSNAWQRWNVEPPAPIANEDLLAMGWVEPSAAHYPHSTAALLERNWRTIRDEILAWHASLNGARHNGSSVRAFEAASGEDDETLLQAGQWRLLRFMHPASDGWIASSVAAAPKTAAVLRTIPALRECAARDSCYELTAQLSHLVSGSHIAPHCGRGRLSLMLPLVAPPGCCRLQVGPAAPRTLVEGKVIVFDDSWEHQAFADADRMVLILDVPRVPVWAGHVRKRGRSSP